jgi:8-oxo-dGTP pyrophosphatase MutT (NUDIX family)
MSQSQHAVPCLSPQPLDDLLKTESSTLKKLNQFSSPKRILQTLYHSLTTQPPLLIPYEPGIGRASVAIVLQLTRHSSITAQSPPTIEALLDEVSSTEKEVNLLYIKRSHRPNDRWSGQLAFPGGRQDPVLDGQSDWHTVLRECREELALDLTAPHCFMLGRLNDRPVYSTLAPWSSTFSSPSSHKRRPLLILSTFVFLYYTCQDDPSSTAAAATTADKTAAELMHLAPDSREVDAVFLVPVRHLYECMWHPDVLLRHPVTFRLPRSDSSHLGVWEAGLYRYLATLRYPAIPFGQLAAFPPSQMRLWGISLWLTVDLLDLTIDPHANNSLFKLRSLMCTGTQFPYWDVNWLLSVWNRRNRNFIGRQASCFVFLQIQFSLTIPFT